ncbi:porin [Teredinibacter turnerae]|uniref:porin n=1 Tax=Teredinibacter turnerae TaxID=2426 RepID=UPI0003731782|nr:porin [Teredinibacter turnerae]
MLTKCMAGVSGMTLMGVLIASAASAQSTNEDATVEALQERIEKLEQELNQRLNIIADEVESSKGDNSRSRVTLGGYGELHYTNLSSDDEDVRELDMHRVVLFVGYEFADNARLVTEWEVEHAISSAGSRGAVEMEQAYVELDVQDNLHWRTGVQLMPLGIINETHEPTTFYGVERPIVETTIIPTTWYSAATSIKQSFANGFSYDVMLSEGLKTEDPTSDPDAEPFNLKAGKQKASFASAYDLAVTGRVAYRGVKGLELAVYGQYQPDLDQSAETSYAESATLVGGHVVYSLGSVTLKGLYASWSLAGDAAKNAGMDVQDGGYAEVNWKPLSSWGFYSRISQYSQQQDESKEIVELGVNYYPLDNVVFKADYQQYNEDAGDFSGVNLGMGYQF